MSLPRFLRGLQNRHRSSSHGNPSPAITDILAIDPVSTPASAPADTPRSASPHPSEPTLVSFASLFPAAAPSPTPAASSSSSSTSAQPIAISQSSHASSQSSDKDPALLLISTSCPNPSLPLFFHPGDEPPPVPLVPIVNVISPTQTRPPKPLYPPPPIPTDRAPSPSPSAALAPIPAAQVQAHTQTQTQAQEQTQAPQAPQAQAQVSPPRSPKTIIGFHPSTSPTFIAPTPEASQDISVANSTNDSASDHSLASRPSSEQSSPTPVAASTVSPLSLASKPESTVATPPEGGENTRRRNKTLEDSRSSTLPGPHRLSATSGGGRVRSNALVMPASTPSTVTATPINVAQDHEDLTTRPSSPIVPAPPRRHQNRRPSMPATGAAAAAAAASVASASNEDPSELDGDLEPTGSMSPAISASCTSTRSRSQSSPHVAVAGLTSPSHRPVSILKNKPKSILRTRSGSQPLPYADGFLTLSSPVPPVPRPPSLASSVYTADTDARLSVASTDSSMSIGMLPSARSSLFLSQDPTIATNSTTTTSVTTPGATHEAVVTRSRRSSSGASVATRRLSGRDQDLLSQNVLSSAAITATTTSPASPLEQHQPGPASTPVHDLRLLPLSSSGLDIGISDDALVQHHQQQLARNTARRLSCTPASFDPDASVSSQQQQQQQQQQPYVPLTLKSARVAKANKNKMRADPPLMTMLAPVPAPASMSGTRRNSIPKSPLLATADSQLPPLPSVGSEGVGGVGALPPSSSSHHQQHGLPSRRTPDGMLSSTQHPHHQLQQQQQHLRDINSHSAAAGGGAGGGGHSATTSTTAAPLAMPRPILKDTTARDRMQRESWMVDAAATPGFLNSGGSSLAPSPHTSTNSTSSSSNRPSSLSYHHHQHHSTPPTSSSSLSSSHPPPPPPPSSHPHSQSQSHPHPHPSHTPAAPPKSLARANSAKRQSRMNRSSTSTANADSDPDVMPIPRPRIPANKNSSSSTAALITARRQSGGYTDFESEDYDDSDLEDPMVRSKILQEQYVKLQKSHLHYSLLESHMAMLAKPSSSSSQHSTAQPHPHDDVSYFEKRGQRRSMGDELNALPPIVPEKSAQRKRISTVSSATVPALSTLGSAGVMETASSALAEASLSTPLQQSQQPQDRRTTYGSNAMAANSLSFEPLFAFASKSSDNMAMPSMTMPSMQTPSLQSLCSASPPLPASSILSPPSSQQQQQLQQQQQPNLQQGLVKRGDPLTSRFSTVSDAEWPTTMSTTLQIPESMLQHGVTILDLTKRELTEIPAGLPSTITHLRLAYNVIQILSPISNLTTLTQLQVLDLCDNQLDILPNEIGLLTRLKELYLSNNKLRKLPDSIQKMARLEVLDVRNNDFYLINPMVGKLKTLRQLDVRNNRLKSVPAQLCLLSSTLNVLLVDGNQFVAPFSELLQPLLVEDSSSSLGLSSDPSSMMTNPSGAGALGGSNGHQSFLGDDPYADPATSRSGFGAPMRSRSVYEPWRRSVVSNAGSVASTPVVTSRRNGNSATLPATLSKRRSHGDLMTFMGLQKKDGNSTISMITDEDQSASVSQRSSTFSAVSGAYFASALASEHSPPRRERAISTSNATDAGSEVTPGSSPTPGSLSLNKFLKSIRKGSSKSSIKELQQQQQQPHQLLPQPSSIKGDPKRYSIGSELDPMADIDSNGAISGEGYEKETDGSGKPTSRGSATAQANSKRGPGSGLNQWMKDRFHKRTNSNELVMDGLDNHSTIETHTVRDSGYGGNGVNVLGTQSSASLRSTPDLALLSNNSNKGNTSSVLGNRYQNKSTGHLPYGSSRDSTVSNSLAFDPLPRKNYRYSYMSMESQMTQGTENDSDLQDPEALQQQQQQQQQLQQQQQQHRLSSLHSPTTPLPSSPIISGMPGHAQASIMATTWNAGGAIRYGQNSAFLKPVMQYLRDLHDLDPDSSEWNEVFAWRRVWSADRTAVVGLGVSSEEGKNGDSAEEGDKEGGVSTTTTAEQAKIEEEMRLAKLQAQATRRRRIVDEIMATERTYVEGLMGLNEIYLTPAQQVMPQGDHKAIFTNAQLIYKFHAQHFLPELEKAYQLSRSAVANEPSVAAAAASPLSPVPTRTHFNVDPASRPSSATDSNPADEVTPGSTTEPSTQSLTVEEKRLSTCTDLGSSRVTTPAPSQVEDRIGRVFAAHVAYMKMYSFYINNYDNALRVLQTQMTQSKTKKKMKEFLRRCARHPNHSQLGLQGYLLLPVQRIPRYKMLLQDLLDNTWREHADYADIATALEQITDRADEMNERKREYENHEKVLLIQNRIVTWPNQGPVSHGGGGHGGQGVGAGQGGQGRMTLVQPHRKVVREGVLHLIRVVTRNVSMTEVVHNSNPGNNNNNSNSNNSNNSSNASGTAGGNSDLTVHRLSEETVEKSFLFILFNDIMIQCSAATAKHLSLTGGSGSNPLGGLGSANVSSTNLSGVASGMMNGGSSGGHSGSGAGSLTAMGGTTLSGLSGMGGAGDMLTKNLELVRTLSLESRLHPAEIIENDVLRVVDDTMVLYLTGDKEVMEAWKEDINSRW